MKPILSLILCCCLFAGCISSRKAPPPKTDSAVVTPASAASSESQAKVSESDLRENETRALAAANVANIQKANVANPPGPTRETIADESKLALMALGTAPDPKELIAGEQRARLRAEGKADAAEKLSQESAARANEAVAAVAVARADRDAALKKVDEALAKAAADIAASNREHELAMNALQKDHGAKIADLQKQLAAKEVNFLSRIVAGIGGLCLLAAIGIGVASFYSPLGFNVKNVGICGILVASAIGCFGLVRFLSHPWIPYAVGGVITVLVSAAAVLWFVNWRETRMEHDSVAEDADQTKAKLHDMTETAAHVVDQLEAWAKDKPDAAKELFSRIGYATDQKHKDLISYLKSVRPSKKASAALAA